MKKQGGDWSREDQSLEGGGLSSTGTADILSPVVSCIIDTGPRRPSRNWAENLIAHLKRIEPQAIKKKKL